MVRSAIKSLEASSVARFATHCSTCRKWSGAPFLAWVVLEKSQFAWVKGAPESISATPAVIRKFCGHCATAIQLIALVVLWYLPELATWLSKLIFGR